MVSKIVLRRVSMDLEAALGTPSEFCTTSGCFWSLPRRSGEETGITSAWLFGSAGLSASGISSVLGDAGRQAFSNSSTNSTQLLNR